MKIEKFGISIGIERIGSIAPLVLILLLSGCGEKKEVVVPKPAIAKPKPKTAFDYFTKSNIDLIKVGLLPRDIEKIFGEPTYKKIEVGNSSYTTDSVRMEYWVYGGTQCLSPKVNCFVFGKRVHANRAPKLGSWKINRVIEE